MTGLMISAAIMAAGVVAAALWSLRRALAEVGLWRWAHLAAALLALGGAAAMAAGSVLQLLAGLLLIGVALALLLFWRSPDRLYAAVHLIWGMVLAIGTPWPLG